MRLLKLHPNGDFHLTDKLLDDVIPQYAILSHTWGSEEVTFEDMVDGSSRDKIRDRDGYKKIEFCGHQAAGDMLQYIWVDSCCIKKSSDSELSESLNSMFRWYQRAAKCYVYLSDVSKRKRKRSNGDLQDAWDQAFRESKWFTRGWTLPELLAPRSVEFFSKEGSRLGDKQSLEQEIHEITGIPISALRGTAVSQFSDDQKFDWAKGRQTTRDEDWAYSLLGIFGISMPVIYGEGRKNAVRRLKKEIEDASKDVKECLRHLYVTDPRADKTRIEESKGGLIADSYHWVIENCDFRQWKNAEQSHLLWIKGDPGKGKTMLLCGIIDELKMSMNETHVLSYFFCQATDSRINNATAVLRGLLYMLLEQQPLLVSHARKQHDHAGEGLFKDANAWVLLSEIFTSVLQDPSLKQVYFIIDALDECVVDLSKLLDFIVQKSSVSSRAKWLVASRNWPLIEEQLDRAESKVTLRLELNDDSVSAAVNTYIGHKVRQLAQEKKYDDKTRDAVQDHFSSNANNTFLWVALACQNLQKVKPWNVLTKLKDFPPGLDSLYRRMMEQIDTSDDADLCKRILASVAIVYRPLTLKELTSLVEMPESITQNLQWLAEIVALCGSFLTIREDVVYFVHQSAKDFLFAEAFDSIFPSGKEETHHEIFSRSLEAMSRTLRRDMYSIGSLGYPIELVKQPDPDPLISIRYSCIHWVDHLCDWNSDDHVAQRVDLEDGGVVDVFVREKFLYWLEALSLCRSMSKGVLSMGKLEAFIRRRTDAPILLDLARDARRFIMYHKPTIEISPLQTYVSALLFSPARSLTKCLFKQDEPNWITIKPAMEDEWNACLQTLEGHSDWIFSVTSSSDSERLATGSLDGTVRIWSIRNGDCLQILRGHEGTVLSVNFSHDSTRLASSSDMTIQTWNTISGERLQIFKGHEGLIRSVAFSNDSVWLASGSEDKTIKIWKSTNGECLMTLQSHEDTVEAVTFSHDSTKVASGSRDKTIKIWDANHGKCLRTLRSHESPVLTVAFSHDSTLLASGSMDDAIIVWNAINGEHLHILKGHTWSVQCVAFSHDSAWLVSSSNDRTVKLWDTQSGNCIQTLKGHNRTVYSTTFIHNSDLLATASADYTVKIWDTNPGKYIKVFEGHTNAVKFVAFSYDSKWLASASDDFTVKIWNTRNGECVQTLRGHSNFVTWVAFSHDSTRLASVSDDSTAKIWDLYSGDCLQTLKALRNWSTQVAFSHDSARLASVSQNYVVKIWETYSGQCLQTLEGHKDHVNSMAFSHHSTLLVSASRDGAVRIWDTGSGACLQMLDHSGFFAVSVAFSYDLARLALGLIDRTVEIWDIGSGVCLQTLDIGKILFNISFDATDSYLLTDTGAIVIDASQDADVTLGVREGQDPRYQGVALSLDKEWITYDSERLVWLPSEYRPSCSAVSGRMIGCGLGSGKVWMCDLQLPQIPT